MDLHISWQASSVKEEGCVTDGTRCGLASPSEARTSAPERSRTPGRRLGEWDPSETLFIGVAVTQTGSDAERRTVAPHLVDEAGHDKPRSGQHIAMGSRAQHPIHQREVIKKPFRQSCIKPCHQTLLGQTSLVQTVRRERENWGRERGI